MDSGLPNDIFAQIGIVVLIALAAKNAILIVEFAMAARRNGAPVAEAALQGARSRFRAVMMTSFAFILGLGAAVDRRRRRRGDAATRSRRRCSSACSPPRCSGSS